MKSNPMKNILTFSAQLPTAKALAQHLEEMPFTELEELDFSRAGFIRNPITQELVSEFEGGLSFCLRYDEKILPAAAVNDEVNKRALAIEDETGQGVKRKEKQMIKEMVLADFVKTAFSRSVLIYAYHHTETNNLFVVTTSKDMAQQLMRRLVTCVGSVETKTTHVTNLKHGLTTRLRALINGGSDRDTFGVFSVGDSCRLIRQMQRGEKKETINYAGIQIDDCQELFERLDSGFGVESLSLSVDGLTFKLTHEFQLKSLEWDGDEDISDEDPIQAWMDDAATKLFLLNHASESLSKMLAYEEGAEEEAVA